MKRTGRTGRAVGACVLAFGILAFGCSDDDSTGSVSAPAQACMDTADAIADAAARCGQDYQSNYDAFVDAVANGDCSNIVGVRDEGSLRNVCIPTLRNLSCDELTSGSPSLPSECMQQLLRQS